MKPPPPHGGSFTGTLATTIVFFLLCFLSNFCHFSLSYGPPHAVEDPLCPGGAGVFPAAMMDGTGGYWRISPVAMYTQLLRSSRRKSYLPCGGALMRQPRRGVYMSYSRRHWAMVEIIVNVAGGFVARETGA